MTVIYSNFGDRDTSVLPMMWEGIPNVNVIEIRRNTADYEQMVDNAILNEHDTIIFCGHGSEHGLFHPDLYRGEYIFHCNNRILVNAQNVIGIWCYASQFAERQRLHGFFSSMFISNINEAYQHGITDAIADDINNDMIAFCQRVNTLLRDNVPLEEWVHRIREQVNEEDRVEQYNYNGLTYIND